MSFREKTAWITLITLIVLTTLILLHMPGHFTLTPEPNQDLFHIVLAAIVIFIAVEIVAHILIRIFSPREKPMPKDERERLIALRSMAISGYIYTWLSLGSAFIGLHLGANAIGLVNLLVLSFIIAEIINYGMRIYYYRRGF